MDPAFSRGRIFDVDGSGPYFTPMVWFGTGRASFTERLGGSIYII